MARYLAHSLIFMLSICCWLSTAEAAVKVAVFPLQDLSQGDDGVNWPLTDQLGLALTEKGFEVLSRQTVISFMARHRIRALGNLETYAIRQARKDLDVTLLVLGTVCQQQTKPRPGVAVVISLIRADDGQTVWSNSIDLGETETRHLLGVHEPQSLDDLYPLLTKKILATWPADISVDAEKMQPFDIESTWLRPVYIHSGQEVQCSVRLRIPWSPKNRPQVLFKVGKRILQGEESIAKGFYDLTWREDGPDGRYPVSIAIQWPDGRRKIILLGSYFVDNQPPELELELKGFELEGKTTFRDRLLILPRLKVREPLTRWHINFSDSEGKSLLSQDGSGAPPERLFWRGQDNSGRLFPEGDYLLTMQVWDRAGNMGQGSKMVTVHRKAPKLTVAAQIIKQELIVDLLNEGTVPVAFWRLDMRIGTEIPLKLAEGTTLPAQISIPVPQDLTGKIITGKAFLQDILGNKTTLFIKDFMTLARPQTDLPAEGNLSDQDWVEEF